MSKEQRTCIYCRTLTSGAEGFAHIIPEAVLQNEWTLARGAVCDHCNNYLGELDAALVQYPPVSILAQFFALPGKRGVPRHALGGIALTVRGDGKRDIELTAHDPEYRVNAEGKNTVRVLLMPPPTFDLLKYRRALHHIAFNAVASIVGEAQVLRPEFDSLRKYLRSPKRGEAWTYAEAMAPTDERWRLRVGWPYENDQNFAKIDLGLIVAVVGLHPDQDFAPIKRAGFSIIDPSVVQGSGFGLTHVAD